MSSPGRFGRWLWLWAIGYLVLLGVVVWSMFAARKWSLAELAKPNSVAQWEAWRDDVRSQQDEPSPVERSVPKSTEPPALVLMRDYFGVSLCGAIVFSTLLYWIMAWLISGTVARPSPTTSDHQASPPADRAHPATDRPES